MQHPKISRSRYGRSAVFAAILLCVAVSGCADREATGPGPGPARVPDNVPSRQVDGVPFNRVFVAWSQTTGTGPIQTQIFGLDARQERQYAWWPDEPVLSFARANPGRLYIVGDEPDQYCTSVDDYAGIYYGFVTGVRKADPTARFSPAGFAEPNDRCCPPGDEQCRQSMHSIGYAQQFYDAYVRSYGSPPPVNEWRFHDFGLPFAVGDMDGWWVRIERQAAWSVAHGANMVLGAWAFLQWREPVSDYQEHMKQAMGRILNDPRINAAVYWSYKPWEHSPHYLSNEDGSLTPFGETYANPLTDVPTDVRILGSADGQAKLRWSNTTYAWGAEAEFWVQAPGSDSFVPQRTERVPSLGAVQTPFVAFNIGDQVKARVRYYNAYGQAGWSPFSKVIVLANEPDKKGGAGKRPLFCVLQLC